MARTAPAPAVASGPAGRARGGTILGRRVLGAVSALALAAVGIGITVPAAQAAVVVRPAVDQPTVSADALPTVQVDGVVWAQTVVGNTVYAAGKFTSARPAGSPAGTNETPRANLLAYDIRTGVLSTTWAPTLNGQAFSIAASPDGSKIYVGGEFTVANGGNRSRFAAFNATTGVLDGTVRPSPNAAVRAIVATPRTIYLGGNFTSISGLARLRAASVSATNGAINAFRADANYAQVDALALTPNGTRLVLGGRFQSINGVAARGSGWVDATTGAVQSFPANQRVQNSGMANGYSAGIASLAVTSELIIGSGWGRLDVGDGSIANVEGMFAADVNTGALVWVADCHGDTYSTFPSSDGHVYLAGHPHSCTNAGGFPEESPRVHRYALAFSQDARRTTVRNTDGTTYGQWAGTPSPELDNWFPTMTPGLITGQNQAGWSVSGNDDYVVYGGEFRTVNGVAQAGLVRFAKRTGSSATEKRGPVLNAAAMTPSVMSRANGTVSISWPANHDPDDGTLTYRVLRTGSATPVATVEQSSRYWDRGRMSVVDTAVTGASTYRVETRDSAGNTVLSNASASVTPVASPTLSAYARNVLADVPANYWRLGDNGATVSSWTGFNNGTSTGVTRGVPDALSGDTDAAMRFTGASGSFAASGTAEAATSNLSVEAWFSTTTTSGGKIVGFGNAATGNSTVADRGITMLNSGQLAFGVNPREQKAITSPASYNDGQWHHVVATLGSTGMRLYVDGALVVADGDVRTGQYPLSGFWRIGGDSVAGLPQTPSSAYFAGSIDEVATYSRPLTPEAVARHYAYGTTGQLPPAAAFTTAVDRLRVDVDASASTDPDGTVAAYEWDFGDGATGTGPVATHTYAAAGTYQVTLTAIDDDGARATAVHEVSVVTGLPTASFVTQTSGLTVSTDATASSDPDGTLRSYAWDFGDGSTGTGATASHAYAAAGTYPITLTVTDDHDQRATTTRSVTVSNIAKVVAQDSFGRTVTSGFGAAEVGGTWTATAGVASVDGNAGVLRLAQASSAASARLASASATTLVTQVTSTMDKVPNGGGATQLVRGRIAANGDEYRLKLQTSSTGKITAFLARSVAGTETRLFPAAPATPASVPGTLTAGASVITKFAVTGTSPTRLQAKVWLKGTTEPAAWLLETTDSTSSLQVAGHPGVYGQLSSSTTNGPVLLRYDDLLVTDGGEPAPAAPTPPAPPAPPANQAPTASFVATTADLEASVDATASTDSDGTIASYAWTWDDGTTGTGSTATRTYASAGTYTVALTVTDDDGATATTSKTVTVTAPAPAPAPEPEPEPVPDTPAGPTVVGRDAFERTVASGFGTADVGGAWVTSANVARVAGGAGVLTLAGASSAAGARLPGAAGTDVTTQVTTTFDKVPNGLGAYALVRARIAANDDAYRLKLNYQPNGQIRLWWTSTVAGKETTLVPAGAPAGSTVLAPVTYAAGRAITVKVSAVGTSPTRLRAKIWAAGTAEPTAWLLDVTDSTASIQTTGHVGLYGQLSSGTTNGPVAVRFDDFVVTTGAAA